ncbi:MAG: ATP-binding protein [Desulfonatronovibrio sp. MSAO_Bac4]|nr:MAG: ATP-binding protein [Desulfonatronovibrio sp. MSAO_Bac4]
MQIEIKKDILISPDKKVMMDMHSLYNIINIISGELQILEMLSDDQRSMKECVDLCLEIKDGLTHADKVVEYAENIDHHLDFIQERTRELFIKYPQLKDEPDAMESLENIKSVLDILKVRATEILARYKEPGQWKSHDLKELTQNFLDVFAAIEKNSKGKYSFVYNIAARKKDDYFVHLDFQSIDNISLSMPPVFQDAMRDLIANARKYTHPGGNVIAGLLEEEQRLLFAVEDTGIGIPEPEIEKVVDFEFRASNARSRQTMGGGFGLTKAYFVIKQFNGRMWIDSKEGRGTRISIQIPRP